jgi:P27 family predicted phage terminase small subunit
VGQRGPKPTPTAIKLSRGTFRADRSAVREAEPIGKPRCPKWLNADAAKEFRRIVKLLDTMGLLGAVDENALARYATTWMRWRQALQMIERGGEVVVYKDEAGKVKAVQPSAFNSIARSLAEELSRLEQAFGMTPSARSRIEVTMPQTMGEPVGKSRFFDPPLRMAQ